MSRRLKELEKLFKENGYSKKLIQEVEKSDNAKTIDEYINNLESEQSYWDC